VDPVPDPLLFFSGSARNRTRVSGSVAKNSDHYTTEAVSQKREHFTIPQMWIINIYNYVKVGVSLGP
jgi:hypothetical protein